MTRQLATVPTGDRAAPPVTGLLQRACACGRHQPLAGGECAECLEQHSVLRRSAVYHDHGETVPHAVHEAIQTPGDPLGLSERAFFEPRFSHDFSDVRIHTGQAASESARRIGAQAYTVGCDIVFGAGQYLPGSPAGRRTLGHELAHVVQQRGRTTAQPLRIGPCDDPLERQADAAADAVLAGHSVYLQAGTGSVPGVHRQCGGQSVPGCEPGMPYLSVPSSTGIGVAYGKWLGLQYAKANPVASYLVVDWWLYSSSGQLGTIFQLGPGGGNLDPLVWGALLTMPDWVTRGFQRTDILDSDRDEVYEIKPRRGAGSGASQLNRYLRQLRRFAPVAPSWMGSRRRNWSPGLWSPAVPLLPVPGPAPGLFFCYLCAWRDDKTPGVIIYDIVCCPNWAALAALAAALGLDRLMDYLRRLGKWMREHAQEIAIAIGVAVALVIAVALIILFWAEIAAGVAALLAALAAGLAALAALFSGLLAPAAVAAAILLIVIGMMESEGPGEEEPGRIAPLAAAGGAGGAPAGAGGEAGPVAAAGPGPPGGGAAGKTGPPEEASA